MLPPRPPHLLLALLTTLPLAAQCPSLWDQTPGFRVQGEVHCVVEWDEDGPGGNPPHLVLGGLFTGAGGVATPNVVRYDPATGTWSPLGLGIDGTVRALAVLPGQQLVAGGSFTSAGGVPVDGIAAWNGSSWQPLGTGVNGAVEALVATPTGDLYAGGTFTLAGGSPASLVARWDGTAWSPLGTGLTPTLPTAAARPGVRRMCLMPSGELFAIGGFTAAGGVAASQAAVWNGAAWSSPGLAVSFLGVARALTPYGTGVVVGGTDFADFLQQWNGTTWTSLGAPGTRPAALTTLANGDLILGGTDNFTNQVRRLRGGTWTTLATISNSSVVAPMCMHGIPGAPAEHFLFGSAFSEIQGVSAGSIATWNGTSWSGASHLFDGVVNAIAVGHDGAVYVGGAFTNVGGVPILRVAKYDGTTWSQVGAGFGSPVTSLAVLGDGTVYAAVQPSAVWRFDGTAWTVQAGAPYGRFVRGPGDELAVVSTGLHVRTATGWQSTGVSATSSPLGATFGRDGQLVACTYYGFPGTVGRVARWNGTSWTSLDPSFGLSGGEPICIAELPNGNLVVGGWMTTPLGVAQRVGTTWQPMGAGLTGTVSSLTVLPDGSLLALGNLTASGTVPLQNAARWNGSQWEPYRVPQPNSSGFISTLVVHPAGDLIYGGSMFYPALRFARLRSQCPADVDQVGPGCSGSNGAARLDAVVWPLLGSSAVTRGSQLPAGSFAVAVRSVTPANLLLSSLLPVTQPGCTLWVQPDLLEVLPVQAGLALSSLSAPLQPTLLGLTYREQWAPFELGAGGALTAVSVTPALALTFGAIP